MPHLEPHPLAALFPAIPDNELQALADDIRQHGQREPVLTYEGKVLDGWNRVRACRLIGANPWLMEFDPASAKMTPEELVISANLRRRHLSVGQMSAIVVELSEKIERDSTRDALAANLPPIPPGRPKTALTTAAEMIGMDERRGRDARAVKAASPEVFAQLKLGTITLNEAMEKIRVPGKVHAPEGSSTEADELAPEIPDAAEPELEPTVAESELQETKAASAATFPVSPMAIPPPTVAGKPAAPRLSRKERIAGAWLDVERVFGAGKYTKWLRDGRLTDDEALEFEKLASDADKKQVRAVMLQNRSFREAADSLTGLNAQNSIEELHTKTVQSGGSFVGQIGEFLHVVAFGDKARAELIERLSGWPAK
jgi:ParB-like chromosome segregation protein Spo0J